MTERAGRRAAGRVRALRRAARAALAFPLAAGAGLACDGTTSPSQLVEGRAAHAIRDGGTAVVRIDNVVQLQLQPLQHAPFLIDGVQHTYQFEHLQDAPSIEVQHTHDLTAIILLELDGQATLRWYGLDFNPAGQRLVVVNAFEAAGEVAVTLEGEDLSFPTTVAPGEAAQLDPPAETLRLTVQAAGDAEPTSLSPILLNDGDHGFIVIVAGPSGAEPYGRLVF